MGNSVPFEDAATVARRVLGGLNPLECLSSAAGQRVRKVVEHYTSGAATLIEERVYFGGFELYRRHQGAGSGLDKEVVRELQTLHVMDGEQRVALVDTRTVEMAPEDTEPTVLGVGARTTRVMYQLGNHLGSACLEVDADGEVVRYEEFHPYGSSALLYAREGVEDAPKRYRFTGMECDDTGLQYHTARYYAPWLGRWTSTDPSGLTDGTDSYTYCCNAPASHADLSGHSIWDSVRTATTRAASTLASAAGSVVSGITSAADRSAQHWAHEYNRAQDRGDSVTQGVAAVLGGLATLATREHLAETALTLATAGVGARLVTGGINALARVARPLIGTYRSVVAARTAHAGIAVSGTVGSLGAAYRDARRASVSPDLDRADRVALGVRAASEAISAGIGVQATRTAASALVRSIQLPNRIFWSRIWSAALDARQLGTIGGRNSSRRVVEGAEHLPTGTAATSISGSPPSTMWAPANQATPPPPPERWPWGNCGVPKAAEAVARAVGQNLNPGEVLVSSGGFRFNPTAKNSAPGWQFVSNCANCNAQRSMNPSWVRSALPPGTYRVPTSENEQVSYSPPPYFRQDR